MQTWRKAFDSRTTRGARGSMLFVVIITIGDFDGDRATGFPRYVSPKNIHIIPTIINDLIKFHYFVIQ